MRQPVSTSFLLLPIFIVTTLLANLVSAGYNVGVGRADITGPAAEVLFLHFLSIALVKSLLVCFHILLYHLP